MPKRIRASVSQTPDEGNVTGNFGRPIIVSLNPEDSILPPIPSNISCNLSINGAIPISPTPGSATRNSLNGINLSYPNNSNQSVTGQPYVLSNFQNWNIADVDDTNGSIRVLPTEAVERDVVRAPAPGTAKNDLSFWDRTVLFLRGLFGLKPS